MFICVVCVSVSSFWLIVCYVHVVSCIHNMFICELLMFLMQKSSSGKPPPRPEYGVVYVAQEYPPWQRQALIKLREMYNEVHDIYFMHTSNLFRCGNRMHYLLCVCVCVCVCVG